MEERNERYQIYDLNDNLLVDDLISSFKNRLLMNPLNGEGYLISFDNKHYFNMAAKELVFKKIEDEKNNFKKIKFDIKNFCKYKTDMWHKICFDLELIDDTVVIYRENDINELDPEVKDLVNTINKLPFTKTISSCSGHGTEKLFVGIKVHHIMVLEVLSKIIFDNFNHKFIITTKCGYEQSGLNGGFSFNIQTKQKGKEAYDLAKKLRDKIEEYILKDLVKDEKSLDNGYINKNGCENINGIEEEISILKNTFNEIRSVYCDGYSIDEKVKKGYVHLVFYNKDILDDILNILWKNFNKDFVLKTNRFLKYVNEDKDNRGTCLTLDFKISGIEIKNKIRLLNKILQNEIIDKK